MTDGSDDHLLNLLAEAIIFISKDGVVPPDLAQQIWDAWGYDKKLTVPELAAVRRTEMAWEWLLAFKSDDKRLTDESVAEFLVALDRAGDPLGLTPPIDGNYQNPTCGELKP